MISADEARRILRYEPDTGRLVWRVRTGASALAGTRAGYVNAGGWRQVGIGRRRYMATALAWLIVTGSWPSSTVDHRNRVRDDDRWENLRLASRQQQSANRSAHNKAGLPKGVQRRKGRFRARIRIDSRLICLGTFNTAEDASAAYAAAAVQAFGEFAAP